uniref:Extracellular matrix protein 1 n=1 Tax=Iconisemion striatum TaxID=60296 RepID=A0A1A7WDH6_9TELE
MGPFGAAVSAAALLLVSLSSACTDVHSCLQREVTMDTIMQERQQPGMLQEEVDLEELLKDFPPIEQKRVVPQRPRGFNPFEQRIVFPPIDRGVLTPRGRRPHPERYPVQFPLGRPTPDNIQAICLHGDHRPRYPNSYFPPSGFSKLKRQAAAVNNAESWFSTCCSGNQTWGEDGTLCCATQAWEKSVDLFCTEDSSVKDRLYECCRMEDNKRMNCFNKDSPNPSYQPTEELPVEPLGSDVTFHFEPNTCLRNLEAPLIPRSNRETPGTNPSAPLNPNISFPPGRPTADNILSLCGHQKLRPLYTTKCLPRSGYQLLARQVKTVNRLEKGFKRCCKQKKAALNCADQKWREELDKFCSSKNGEQVDFHCCSGEKAGDRYSCFQSASPDSHYNLTFAPEENVLTKLCGTRNLAKASLPVSFKKKILKQCCPLPDGDKNNCLVQEINETPQNFCSSNNNSPVFRLCCTMPSHEDISDCVSKLIMDILSRATHAKGQKKKKICPIP